MLLNSATAFSIDEFWFAIALTAIPGVLGGITFGVSVFLKEIKAHREDWPPSGNLSKLAFFSAQALSGMGGSLAALLVTLWANRFPDPFYEIKAWLSLVCTGFVAGYVANRLLPAIADSLYNRLTKLAEKADEAGNKAEEAKQAVSEAQKQTRMATQMASEMVRVRDYLAGKDFSQQQKTQALIATLNESVKYFPSIRTLSILLARLYDQAANDRQSAIDVLVRFIEAKKQIGEGSDASTADAYWNLADYYYYERPDYCEEKDGVQIFAARAVRKDAALLSKGVDSMRESIQRVPSYYQALLEDQDFTAMRESPEGMTMLSEAKQQYGQWTQTQGAQAMSKP